jgi:hypothetical protein
VPSGGLTLRWAIVANHVNRKENPMTDNETALGRIDALELLVAELLVKAELKHDPLRTDHEVQGSIFNLMLDRANAMKESGLSQARVSAFNAQMNGLRDIVLSQLKLRRPVAQ